MRLALYLPPFTHEVNITGINNWTEVQHHNAWTDLPGNRYGKLFIGRPRKERADDLLNPLALELDIYSLAHHLCKM